MFRIDRHQAQPSDAVRLVVSGELTEAARVDLFAVIEGAQREAAMVELDLHDVTRVDRSMVGCLAVLCAKGVQVARCPAYLERWFRDEREAAALENPQNRQNL